MSLTLGFVIQHNIEKTLFAGYKHPGTRATGFPVWVRNLENTNFDGGRAAIFNTAKDANDVMLSIFGRDNIDCTVQPVGILE